MLGRKMRFLVAAVTAALALLLGAASASANFVYWANNAQGTIGRAKISGTGVNNAFISGLTGVQGVAVDSKFIYWTQGTSTASSIGRANLDGSAPNPNFIPHAAGVQDFDPAPSLAGIAINSSSIFWINTGSGMIGRANLDGSSPTGNLAPTGLGTTCGLAADKNFVYWLNHTGGGQIGRAPVGGGSAQPSFITGVTATNSCGLAVDPDFLYWDTSSQSVGRAPVGGGAPDNAFVPAAVPTGNKACGVAVNTQYVFWGNSGSGPSIGRANLSGGAPNPSLFAGPTDPCLMDDAPANKITVDSITRKKKKGTAAINAKVPGPGQITLDQISTPPDTNAVAAAVKTQGLTITSASSFTLAVKPVGKTAKKLNKQIKKQLRKKRKAKATVKQTVFIHFVPAGVAGVPNDQQVTVTLVKQRKKK